MERYEYGDYGVPTILDSGGNTLTESAIGNPYLFNGRRYDAESGFYWYRTRYLDPIHGRFTTRDTIGTWGDPTNLGNGYAYVGNNPWTKLDPWGMDNYCAHCGERLKRCPSCGKSQPNQNSEPSFGLGPISAPGSWWKRKWDGFKRSTRKFFTGCGWFSRNVTGPVRDLRDTIIDSVTGAGKSLVHDLEEAVDRTVTPSSPPSPSPNHTLGPGFIIIDQDGGA